jgi:hypothetical protein
MDPVTGAAAIPEDVDGELPETDGNDADVSETVALDNEVRDQASEYVASDEGEADEKDEPTKKEAKGDDKEEKKVDAEKKPVQQKKNGAQERIRQLVEKSKQAEQRAKKVEHRAAQAERQFRQWQQQQARQFEETQKRLAEREREHAVAMKELELIRQREQEAQEAALDPLEKAMRIERRKATSELDAKYKQELAGAPVQ